MRSAIFLALSACAPFMHQRGIVVQDCVSTHIKALGRSEAVAVTKDYYETVVDACDRIFEGRPK